MRLRRIYIILIIINRFHFSFIAIFIKHNLAKYLKRFSSLWAEMLFCCLLFLTTVYLSGILRTIGTEKPCNVLFFLVPMLFLICSATSFPYLFSYRLPLSISEWNNQIMHWSSLEGVLCTRFGGKGSLVRGFSPAYWPDGYAMLMTPTRAKQPSMASTAGVMWMCACVRYWPYRGVGTCAWVHNLVVSEWNTLGTNIKMFLEFYVFVSCKLVPTKETC